MIGSSMSRWEKNLFTSTRKQFWRSWPILGKKGAWNCVDTTTLPKHFRKKNCFQKSDFCWKTYLTINAKCKICQISCIFEYNLPSISTVDCTQNTKQRNWNKKQLTHTRLILHAPNCCSAYLGLVVVDCPRFVKLKFSGCSFCGAMPPAQRMPENTKWLRLFWCKPKSHSKKNWLSAYRLSVVSSLCVRVYFNSIDENVPFIDR